jgi:hypothetical protein
VPPSRLFCISAILRLRALMSKGLGNTLSTPWLRKSATSSSSTFPVTATMIPKNPNDLIRLVASVPFIRGIIYLQHTPCKEEVNTFRYTYIIHGNDIKLSSFCLHTSSYQLHRNISIIGLHYVISIFAETHRHNLSNQRRVVDDEKPEGLGQM